MKILLCSVPFSPSVGGIEAVSELLAEAFVRRGHAVTVVTRSPARGAAGAGAGAGGSPDEDLAGSELVRQPSAARLAGLVRWADVVFHNNISLRLAWPLAFWRRPWVVAHHTWLAPRGAGGVKRQVLRFAHNIAASHALAARLPVASVVLPNPYRQQVFRPIPGIQRDRDLVFVGRLVSDKGAMLLLQSLCRLRALGQHPSATLVGAGPEGPALRAFVEAQQLQPQVVFAGRLEGEALARMLHRHRLMVVPSLWEEPFGLVALEGLACGCVPVVARSGGLPEAIGPCGAIFGRGDVQGLADTLAALLAPSADLAQRLHCAPAHLARHAPDRAADSYLRVIEDACQHHRAAWAT